MECLGDAGRNLRDFVGRISVTADPNESGHARGGGGGGRRRLRVTAWKHTANTSANVFPRAIPTSRYEILFQSGASVQYWSKLAFVSGVCSTGWTFYARVFARPVHVVPLVFHPPPLLVDVVFMLMYMWIHVYTKITEGFFRTSIRANVSAPLYRGEPPWPRVACSASYRQGSHFETYGWRVVLSRSSRALSFPGPV